MTKHVLALAMLVGCGSRTDANGSDAASDAMTNDAGTDGASPDVSSVDSGANDASLDASSLVNPYGGSIYWVSTNGSDSNPGTFALPFRTLGHGYGKAVAGDIVAAMPGTYTDYQSGWGLHLGSSGTANKPITLLSVARGQAVIDGQNASDRNEAIYLGGSFNVVSGFRITGGTKGGIAVYGSSNRIEKCEIDHNGNTPSSSTYGQDGVYSEKDTTDNAYDANAIHDNGRTGSNLDHGFYLCGNNEVITNNIVTSNASNGLQIAGYTSVNNMKVHNNVFAQNGTNGIILWMTLAGVDIENNVLYDNGHSGIGSYAATGSGVVIAHNDTFGNAQGAYNLTSGGSTFTYTLGTNLTSDPMFVSGGYQLANGSPAIDTGATLSDVPADFVGTSRPQGNAYDIGAYDRAP